jgi:hypothetical protein
MYLLVRVDSNPLGLAGSARKIVQRFDPSLPIADVLTMEEVWPQIFRIAPNQALGALALNMLSRRLSRGS